MAHIPLKAIGFTLDKFLDKKNQDANAKFTLELKDELKKKRSEVAEGWGKKYQERVHEKGKLTSRERINILKDSECPIFEIGTFVNYGKKFKSGKKDLESPAAGVVTCFTKVQKRWVVIIANDNTVASGSWWPGTPEKIQRAQNMALNMGLPVIYLVDCSGLFLPEQSKSFPGSTGAGHIFKKNSELSAKGVPQIAGVFGDCIAGGGYMPIISDRVYMTEQAYMVIAGAALIKGAKSQNLTSLGIGGPEVHVEQSGCADVRVPDDLHCLEEIKKEIAKTASSAAPFRRGNNEAKEPKFSHKEINNIFPENHRAPYNVKEIIARLIDDSMFWEIMPSKGKEIITGIAQINGLYCGIIANVQGLIKDPEEPKRMVPGGILYRDGIAKISEFSRACNSDGIPIVWLQDISGFDIGAEAEAKGLLGYGSNLIYTNSTNDVPMFTVLLRKASGAGYYAMAGLPYEPTMQLSTTLARQSVMEGRTLAIAAFNTKLNDQFEIVANTEEELSQIQKGMEETEKRIEKDMCPYKSASQRDTDEIVSPDELRPWLCCLIEAAYQSQSQRRVKNSRIWTMHDLHALHANDS